MLPSDHFVRFYNEVFKYLDKKGESHLEKYWLEVSRHQEMHCLDLFKEKSLQGMYDYWEHIRIEENCDMTLSLSENCMNLKMDGCPSLSKVIDNDASPSPRYCDHCPGWVGPMIRKSGHYIIYNITKPDEPKCECWIYKDKNKALEKSAELEKQGIKHLDFVD